MGEGESNYWRVTREGVHHFVEPPGVHEWKMN